MANNDSSKAVQSQSSSQFNARLPKLTHTQINNMAAIHGLTKTQVVIVAVDRLARDLAAESFEASKDVKRLKTVARIAPQIDLGQEDAYPQVHPHSIL
jgi:hypothetical protein